MKWTELKENGFIVEATRKLFKVLEQISIFQAIRNVSAWIWILRHKAETKGKSCSEKLDLYKQTKPFTNSYLFPELWVVVNIVCGLCAYALFSMKCVPQTLGIICAVLAMMRAFEIMVYHMKVLIFDSLNAKIAKKDYAIKSTTRMLILLLCNMFEYVLCFSIIYQCAIPTDATTECLHSFVLSTSAFFNIDFHGLNILPPAMLVVVRIETILGIFMNLICIARFINMLPNVETLDKH
jgi:hypothetical protein